MRIDNRSNVRFGSHFVFTGPASQENTAKLVEDFRIMDCASPFSMPQTQVKRLYSITSILDVNDALITQALKTMGIKIKKTIPSVKYYAERFKGKKAPIAAAKKFVQSGWETRIF